VDLTYVLEAIGNGLGGLVEFESNLPMGTQLNKALSFYFSTLVRVDLGSRIESTITLDILYSCPKLVVLRVGGVDVQKMAERGPWVCQHLRALTSRFVLAWVGVVRIWRIKRLGSYSPQACLLVHVQALLTAQSAPFADGVVMVGKNSFRR